MTQDIWNGIVARCAKAAEETRHLRVGYRGDEVCVSPEVRRAQYLLECALDAASCANWLNAFGASAPGAENYIAALQRDGEIVRCNGFSL